MEEKRSVFREYGEAILIAAIFLAFTNVFVVKTFYIPSGSMEETLLVGDHLFVNRFVFGPAPTRVERALLPSRQVRRGDIVVFRSPEPPHLDLVKRCIALPGDQVEIVAKQLFINGQAVEDTSYTQHVDSMVFPASDRVLSDYRVRDNLAKTRIPEGHYFCMGDNRDNSRDSRFWGPVPEHLIKGRASIIYWSYGGDVPDGSARTLADRGRSWAGTALGFFKHTRWKRSFKVAR